MKLVFKAIPLLFVLGLCVGCSPEKTETAAAPTVENQMVTCDKCSMQVASNDIQEVDGSKLCSHCR